MRQWSPGARLSILPHLTFSKQHRFEGGGYGRSVGGRGSSLKAHELRSSLPLSKAFSAGAGPLNSSLDPFYKEIRPGVLGF